MPGAPAVELLVLLLILLEDVARVGRPLAVEGRGSEPSPELPFFEDLEEPPLA